MCPGPRQSPCVVTSADVVQWILDSRSTIRPTANRPSINSNRHRGTRANLARLKAPGIVHHAITAGAAHSGIRYRHILTQLFGRFFPFRCVNPSRLLKMRSRSIRSPRVKRCVEPAGSYDPPRPTAPDHRQSAAAKLKKPGSIIRQAARHQFRVFDRNPQTIVARRNGPMIVQ